MSVVLMGDESVVPRPRGWAPAVCAVGLSLTALALVSLVDPSSIRGACELAALSLSLGALLVLWAVSCGQCPVGSVLWGPAPVEISEVSESRKMDVAHGLAWSIYLGYLKLVLPELEGQVKKHCNETREVLNSARLHILLPLSAAATARLEEVDRNVQYHKNLPDLQLDRAGVRGRVYKHSIYKITDQNQKDYYCVAEYATPLLTLYQISQDGIAGFSAWDRRQQVLLFYNTLTHILESSLECRNRYRLILLEDDQAAEPHYLSQELIKNLQQEEHEIPMEQGREFPRPVAEVGLKRAPVQHNGVQEQPACSMPSLEISGPMSLRSL
uniref:Stimulator of interferon genes protein n=1 Tax=Astyanax mexicanus TaxID=7994 RepID=A0A8B9GXK8_ASTMX